MGSREMTARLRRLFKAAQTDRRGQGAEAGQQAIEATCLTILALRNDQTADIKPALHAVENSQNKDGSWSAFFGDDAEGCWTTSIVVLSFDADGTGDQVPEVGNPLATRHKRERSELAFALEIPDPRQKRAVRSDKIRMELGFGHDELGNSHGVHRDCTATNPSTRYQSDGCRHRADRPRYTDAPRPNVPRWRVECR